MYAHKPGSLCRLETIINLPSFNANESSVFLDTGSVMTPLQTFVVVCIRNIGATGWEGERLLKEFGMLLCAGADVHLSTDDLPVSPYELLKQRIRFEYSGNPDAAATFRRKALKMIKKRDGVNSAWKTLPNKLKASIAKKLGFA